MSTSPITPEVIEDPAKLPRDLLALQQFAHLMDEAFAIPGTRRRVGIDAAIGLIPGVGDAIGALMSTWIVFSAMRHRVPLRILSRMMVNVLVDLGVGAIPVAGDLFDFFWKENLDNVALLIRHRNRRRPPRSFASIALGMAVVLIVILVAAVAAIVGIGALITAMMRS